MTEQSTIVAAGVGSLSPVALASVLDQSVDCVKLIGLDGEVQYMNGNGLCAMEVDDFNAIRGRQWVDLWPEEARQTILDSLATSAGGKPVRFRAFCPTAKGSPRWWDVSVSAVTNAAGAHAGYLSISRDMTDNETATEALAIAADEMRHRLKNTYTMISSLLMSFARGDAARESYASEMAERLVALSTAQALFVSKEASCTIGVLIPALLAPFNNPACPVTITGSEAIDVDQGQADAIALVVGELAVNSSKHGAIAKGGDIQVDWQSADQMLEIRWVEQLATRLTGVPRAGGQGLRLMERIMRARRGGIAFDWRDDGVTVTLTLNLS
ncbi:MAG: PAS domain S-box protein [Sphingomonadales bacterium]|nr:MAG: PAS domain S-box protein [Sphingomonadales bacterium]